MNIMEKFNDVLLRRGLLLEEVEADVQRNNWNNYKIEKALEIIRGGMNTQLYYIDSDKMDELAFTPISITVLPEEAGIEKSEARIMQNEVLHYMKVLLKEINQSSAIIKFSLLEYNISRYEFYIEVKF